MPREIRFKVNPNQISYLVYVKFYWDANDPENTSELKKLTLGQACNIIERDKKDLNGAEIWGNVWRDGNNKDYECVATYEFFPLKENK